MEDQVTEETEVERLRRFLAMAGRLTEAAIIEERKAKTEAAVLREALEKLKGYNADIMAGRINYRPGDHLNVIDKALGN